MGAAVALVLSAGAWVAYKHDFAFREERVTIPGSAQPLEGVLALPKVGGSPHGLVVFVHGDGAANATRDDFYKPIWDAFARAGYASLSWNKPGVDGAPGNWLDQTMHDRAVEAEAVIDWARTRSDIDAQRVGLWGISQGGWVVPEIASRREDLQFAILVGSAVNWERQGEYNLLAEARARRASQEEIDIQLRRRNDTLRLLRDGAGYEEYRDAGIDPSPMTADRWNFVAANFRSDVSDLLPKVKIPLLLCLGEGDLNVDVAETERVYRELVPTELLTVLTYPDASHNIVKADYDKPDLDTFDSFRAALVALFSPTSLYAPGYLDDLRNFAEQQPTVR